MYRLSEYSSPLLQKLVTNEIIRGFQAIFSLDDGTNLIQPDNAEQFFQFSEVLSRILEEGLVTREGLATKLSIMYMAMKDEQFEYTFDEFGEFLLYEMIDLVDTDLCETVSEWEPGGTWFDRKHLRNEIMEALEDCYEDDRPDEEKIQATLNAMTMFPRLADELEGETLFSFAFWDTDFYDFYEEDFDAVVDRFRSHPEMGYSNGKMTKYPLGG